MTGSLLPLPQPPWLSPAVSHALLTLGRSETTMHKTGDILQTSRVWPPHPNEKARQPGPRSSERGQRLRLERWAHTLAFVLVPTLAPRAGVSVTTWREKSQFPLRRGKATPARPSPEPGSAWFRRPGSCLGRASGRPSRPEVPCWLGRALLTSVPGPHGALAVWEGQTRGSPPRGGHGG